MAADLASTLGRCRHRGEAVQELRSRAQYAILTLLLRLGLRRGEVATLHLGDIDWRPGELVIRGKGRREERLPLPIDVGEAVAGWLRHGRPRCSCTNVFTRVHASLGAMSPAAVSHVVWAASKRAGVAPVNAHRLRHTAATRMLRAGAGLGEVGRQRSTWAPCAPWPSRGPGGAA